MVTNNKQKLMGLFSKRGIVALTIVQLLVIAVPTVKAWVDGVPIWYGIALGLIIELFIIAVIGTLYIIKPQLLRK